MVTPEQGRLQRISLVAREPNADFQLIFVSISQTRAALYLLGSSTTQRTNHVTSGSRSRRYKPFWRLLQRMFFITLCSPDCVSADLPHKTQHQHRRRLISPLIVRANLLEPQSRPRPSRVRTRRRHIQPHLRFCRTMKLDFKTLVVQRAHR